MPGPTTKPNEDPQISSLADQLEKPPGEIKLKDVKKFVKANDIKIVSFRYVAGDGRLKQLDIPSTEEDRLEDLLKRGERVDGSSLFEQVDVNASDLYVIPRYGKSFLDPFARPAKLNILCNFFTGSGERFRSGPAHVAEKASKKFTKETGFEMLALGELEFYTIHEIEDNEIFAGSAQSNYQEALPFSKGTELRTEILQNLDGAGLDIKYGHSEVGNIPDRGGKRMVQHEIEFKLAPLTEMADQISIAKWIIRRIAYENNIETSFAPKLKMGHAGSSLHIHAALRSETGENITFEEENGNLTEEGKGIINGFLNHAKSLTAFGNQVPSSYLRFVPGQEAPIKICWGHRNRSALVRIPLTWNDASNPASKINPSEGNKARKQRTTENRQTIEIRSPDGTAHPHYLLAALGLTALQGLKSNDKKIVEDLSCEKDVFEETDGDEDSFDKLPESCGEAAKSLENDREVYEENGVFTSEIIDGVIEVLKGRETEEEDLAEHNQKKLKQTIDRYLHCS